MRSLALLVFLALVASQAAADRLGYVGYAYDLESGELVYVETHTETPTDSGVELRTEYRDPGGSLFASRRAQFSGAESSPEFEMVDQRSDYAEGANREGDGLRAYRQVGNKRESKQLKPSKRPLIVDAGFDRWIKQEWERLLDGDRVRADFLSSARLSLVSLRLSREGERQTASGPVTDFRLEPANWLIRLLVDPIRVSYRSDDRTLFEYRGISNLRAPDGSNFVVRIEFPPEERVAHSSQDSQATRAL